jgi:hypothetical protein
MQRKTPNVETPGVNQNQTICLHEDSKIRKTPNVETSGVH